MSKIVNKSLTDGNLVNDIENSTFSTTSGSIAPNTNLQDLFKTLSRLENYLKKKQKRC
jgi:hypothetical protein